MQNIKVTLWGFFFFFRVIVLFTLSSHETSSQHWPLLELLLEERIQLRPPKTHLRNYIAQQYPSGLPFSLRRCAAATAPFCRATTTTRKKAEMKEYQYSLEMPNGPEGVGTDTRTRGGPSNICAFRTSAEQNKRSRQRQPSLEHFLNSCVDRTGRKIPISLQLIFHKLACLKRKNHSKENISRSNWQLFVANISMLLENFLDLFNINLCIYVCIYKPWVLISPAACPVKRFLMDPPEEVAQFPAFGF